MKFQPVILTAIAFITGVLIAPNMARAQADGTQDIIEQMRNISNRSLMQDQQRNEALIKALDENFNSLKKGTNDTDDEEDEKQTEGATIVQLLPAYEALPTAMSQTELLIHDLMDNRYRELNHITTVNKDHMTGQEKPEDKFKVEYLVDSSWSTPVSTQAFDIFMRYFCDPKASAGRLENSSWQLSNVKHKDETVSYTLACGKIMSGSTDISTRETLLGEGNEDTTEGRAVIGLPLRPADLFFAPTTQPTTTGSDTNTVNTNKMADVYYGAFAQSLQFLVGEPDPVSTTLDTQGKISRKMLASYPFAMLFAERAGTMGPATAQAVSALMKSKLGSATDDPVITQHLMDLDKRNTISMAEYMDMVANQLMTSPGYYTRISTELSPEQLRREEVWLTAIQTALNYQRNRWLEIQAALEAVRK